MAVREVVRGQAPELAVTRGVGDGVQMWWVERADGRAPFLYVVDTNLMSEAECAELRAEADRWVARLNAEPSPPLRIL